MTCWAEWPDFGQRSEVSLAFGHASRPWALFPIRNRGGFATYGAQDGCQICVLRSTINGLAFLPGVRVSMDGEWILFPVLFVWFF